MQIPPWSEVAQSVLDNLNSVLGRTDAKGNCYKRMPNMEQTLQQVEEHDIGCAINTGEKGFALFQNANLWQMMSGTAHARVVQIARSPEAHTGIAVNGAVVATYALLRGRRL